MCFSYNLSLTVCSRISTFQTLTLYTRNNIYYLKHIFPEKYLRELLGGHGLLGTQEPGDREPIGGAVRSRGGGALMEGRPFGSLSDIISLYSA